MPLMYDSTNAADIPTTAPIVAGYIDGAYVWSPADWARFPNALHVRIACFASTDGGQVLDVEEGCATPAEAPGWAAKRRLAGVEPTIYCSASVVGAVQAAFTAQGVPQPLFWVADWTGSEHLHPGSVATQFANPPASGGHFDLSVTNGTWPGGSAPAPAPTPQGLDFMPVNLPVLQAGIPPSSYTKNLQVLLNTHAGGLSVDGIYGPATTQAVKNFQTVMGLSVDGIVGPNTWAALLKVA